MSRPIPIQFIDNIIRQKIRGIENRVKHALGRVAVDSVSMVRKRTPKAFGELINSVHAVLGTDTAKTVIDAPHAKAVEIGSGPHQPNMEKLTEWVRLRGAQGLTGRGRLRQRFSASQGATTPSQAKRVAGMIKPLEVRASRAEGGHLPTDAAHQVAERIAAGIRKHGTRPFWMVRRSLTEIASNMGRRVRAAVKK